MLILISSFLQVDVLVVAKKLKNKTAYYRSQNVRILSSENAYLFRKCIRQYRLIDWWSSQDDSDCEGKRLQASLVSSSRVIWSGWYSWWCSYWRLWFWQTSWLLNFFQILSNSTLCSSMNWPKRQPASPSMKDSQWESRQAFWSFGHMDRKV